MLLFVFFDVDVILWCVCVCVLQEELSKCVLTHFSQSSGESFTHKQSVLCPLSLVTISQLNVYFGKRFRLTAICLLLVFCLILT